MRSLHDGVVPSLGTWFFRVGSPTPNSHRCVNEVNKLFHYKIIPYQSPLTRLPTSTGGTPAGAPLHSTSNPLALAFSYCECEMPPKNKRPPGSRASPVKAAEAAKRQKKLADPSADELAMICEGQNCDPGKAMNYWRRHRGDVVKAAGFVFGAEVELGDAEIVDDLGAAELLGEDVEDDQPAKRSKKGGGAAAAASSAPAARASAARPAGGRGAAASSSASSSDAATNMFYYQQDGFDVPLATGENAPVEEVVVAGTGAAAAGTAGVEVTEPKKEGGGAPVPLPASLVELKKTMVAGFLKVRQKIGAQLLTVEVRTEHNFLWAVSLELLLRS